jgi:nitric oxide reductase subunit B
MEATSPLEHDQQSEESMKRLWIAFVAVMVLSFLVLGWIGTRIYSEMPPLPQQVVTTDGVTLIGSGEISAGQNVWQSMGGMEVGSIWGHGSYVAPDWTADWLHREAVFILDRWSNTDYGSDFEKLNNEQQAQLVARLTKLLHTNTYDPSTGTVTVDPIRVEAFESNLAHYTEIFSKGNADYAIPAGAVSNPDRLRKLSAFFFWTAWAASTDRPNDISTYTNNWPHEPLIGNRPTGDTIVWTGVSIIMLLAGISAMAWWYASNETKKRNRRPQRAIRWHCGKPHLLKKRPSNTSGSSRL